MADIVEDVMVFYPSGDMSDKATHFMGAVVTIWLLMCAVRDTLGADSPPRKRIQKFYLTNFGYEGT